MDIPRAFRAKLLTESYWPADTSRQIIDWTLGQALREVAKDAPDRVALVDGVQDPALRRRWTYAELLADAERTATALLNRFEPGERVAVWAPNVPEWVLLLYGCAIAGVVLVTVNPAYKARELEYVLKKSRAAGLFATEEYRGHRMLETAGSLRSNLPLLRDITGLSDFEDFLNSGAKPVAFPEVKPLDPCVIMFTSGTTGAQKGVVLHHKGISNVNNFTQERGGLKHGGVYVSPMPMFHSGGLGHAGVGSVVRRATHVMAREWNPRVFLDLVASEGGTYTLLVPTMIEALLAVPELDQYELGTFKNMIAGAAVVEASLIERAHAKLGATICNIYGQTELQGVVSGVHPDDSAVDKAETIGQPMPGAEVKIADPQSGKVLALGEQGEICARGYQTMIEYFDMPEESAKTLKADGWLHTGDLGSMDERGFIKITGRIKDMIIRGGENIYPREIENLLLEHPRISKVAVVGVPDTYWGEQVGAFVIPRSMDDPPTPEQLHDFCRANLAPYKTPKLWYFVKEFPWTETGKLQKFKLVESIKKGEVTAVTVQTQ
ncbi:MAG: AMP-binding protein [Burkholderiaceae bacterium]|nr:AMP-binding protein [Burkholderiaceae bacterium]